MIPVSGHDSAVAVVVVVVVTIAGLPPWRLSTYVVVACRVVCKSRVTEVEVNLGGRQV
jgi:hypothetical protein